MNKVYILFQDVPHEFGQIHGVFSSWEAGNKYKQKLKDGDAKRGLPWNDRTESFYAVEEWSVSDE